MRISALACGCASAALCLGGIAWAQDSTTYQYDALGRITSAQSTGTAARRQSACYDPAGNRTAYKSSAAGTAVNCSAPAPTPTPGPTPTPTPPPGGNLPPVANPDTAPSIPKCGGTTVNVIANDTDPEGNYPLVVTGASSGAALIVTVISSSTLMIESVGASGTKSFSYTVRDSLGATSTGSGSILVTTVNACS